ncbi:hypothetical protein ACI3L1_14535 [Deinococcus sp. SM5_A1]|uniref:hypothetical protein n=1 Tax=Deinococcus sp. SM5_A1 TaxID=3379094 RepID=UPI00385D8E2F
MQNVLRIQGAKWGLLGGLSLALVACGGGLPTPQASDQPTVQTISGKVSGWQGEGRVAVSGLPGASSSVHTDGSFTLTLPGEAELTKQSLPIAEIAGNLDCLGSVQSSAPDARAFTLMSLDVKDGAGARQTSAMTGSKPGLLSRRVNVRVWMYSDSATQLRGTMDCAKILSIPQLSTLPVTVAVNVQPGWNVVELNIQASANILAQVSGSGTMANSTAGDAQTTFRTTQELHAQVAF